MRKIVIFLLLICILTVYGWSQHGKIIGTVTDKEGNPQEKVTVTIVSVKSSAKKIEVQTNKEGKFSQIGLWPDYYHVTFKKSGFMPISREIRVRIASPTEMEIILDKAQDMMERNLSAADKLFLKGNKLYAEQKYDEPIQSYNDALELSQSQWGYYFNLGLALHQLGSHPEATTHFKKAVELDPTNSAMIHSDVYQSHMGMVSQGYQQRSYGGGYY